jgi:hypothetical protein
MNSPADYIPRLDVPGTVVKHELDFEDGRPVALFTYDDGLVLRLYVDEDRVRFEANRDWHLDPETGAMVSAKRGDGRTMRQWPPSLLTRRGGSIGSEPLRRTVASRGGFSPIGQGKSALRQKRRPNLPAVHVCEAALRQWS